MLVFSRKNNEGIVIGGDRLYVKVGDDFIPVKPIKIKTTGSTVSMKIDADRLIPVHRTEVYDKLQREKEEAEEAKTATAQENNREER